MIKKTILIVLILIFISFIPMVNAENSDLDSASYNIEINKLDKKITITENIIINGETGYVFDIWIQNDSKNYEIDSGDIELNNIGINNNIYTYKIITENVKKNDQLTLTINYELSKNKKVFQKKFLFNNTKEITMKYNGNTIYIGENIDNNSFFKISLTDSEETEVADLDNYLIGIVIILVIIILVLGFLSLKKQQKTKKKDIQIGSEELLTTKKTLLMSVLKDIEKKHRSKKISDDTYNKLKDQYKQDTVEIMKKLDQLKSKVK